MAAMASHPTAGSPAAGLPAFDPAGVRAFRFIERSIDDAGHVRLVYGLDDSHTFVETYDIPVPPGASVASPNIEAGLDLLHWTAGVSYYKTALPGEIALETGTPTPAVAELLDALYSEGLGELAFKNEVPIPRPRFASRPTATRSTVARGESRATSCRSGAARIPPWGSRSCAPRGMSCRCSRWPTI